MNGGDTDTGGAKVNPNNTPSLTPQPDTSTASDAEAESILTISHDDHPTSVGPQPISQPATAEPAVPPTPPVQSAPSTTVSTPTTQPASSTMPVPPITDFPQSAPQTPQPVGQPVAPVVTPANQFASSTATALPPQPLTPSQFPPQQPVQFPAQPIPASSGDVVLDSSAPKKSRKGLIIVLILLAVLAIGAIVALVIFQASRTENSDSQSSQNNTEQFSTKEEVRKALWEFNELNYSPLIEEYSTFIGLTPDLKMSDYQIIFPAENIIESLYQKSEKAIESYNPLSKKIPDILPGSINTVQTKEEIESSLQGMQSNIDIIYEFYNTYITPLFDTSRPASCTKTQDMIALEKDNTKEAANEYYTLYCESLNFLKESDDANLLKDAIAEQANKAAASLNSILTKTSSASEPLNNLLEELRK